MSKALTFFALAVLYISSTREALAYLDPGTGAMLTQAIIGMIAVGMITIRSWWHFVKTLPNRIMSKVKGTTDSGSVPR
jgi:hypothetical protein